MHGYLELNRRDAEDHQWHSAEAFGLANVHMMRARKGNNVTLSGTKDASVESAGGLSAEAGVEVGANVTR